MINMELRALIDGFSAQIDSYEGGVYNETQVRRDFLDKVIKILGWDVDNQSGLAESFRDVIHEGRLMIEGRMKAPDYIVQAGGRQLFCIEAKKPSVNIHYDSAPAFQIRRYGWSSSMPACLLSSFCEFAVYDTSIKPQHTEDAACARVFYCRYDELLSPCLRYPEAGSNWDFLYSLFSKEAVYKGALDKFKASNKKKGTQEVDEAFLQDIERWREALANNICLRNDIGERELNFVIQKTIDRIIFLRICEDRGIESVDILKTIAGGKEIYKHLLNLFMSADDKYNSGLFHFHTEKGVEPPDSISETLVIDDKVLRGIIKSLYYPAPYEFAVIPAYILGSIYERFLGKVIRRTGAHRAKVEEKPEVRKAGGVYYTPQYIVDYIVKHTVGAKLAGKTPETLGAFRVVDPACGSGSFLINAYQYLLDWYLAEYIQAPALYSKQLLKIGDNDYKLAITERKHILTAHIYGVDIDAQAVEVARLSLLLKALEGLSAQEIQKNLFKERVLPNLSCNIKCGNSLISSDFYAGALPTLDEQYKINAFDWESEFVDAFKDGGFDAVVGNPPYGAELRIDEREYLEKKFKSGITDTAALFMLQAADFLNDTGINGFIIPKAFTYASNWKKTRDKLLKDIYIIADCGKVWSNVKLEMTIYINLKNSDSKSLAYYKRDGGEIKYFGKKDKKLCAEFDLLLNGVTQEEIDIGIKMKRNNKTLNDFVTNQRGAMLQKKMAEKADIKVLGGKQIGKYTLETNLIKGSIAAEDIDDEKALLKQNSILVQRIIAHVEKPNPHILITACLNKVQKPLDFVILDTINQLENTSCLSSEFILGILNSRLVSWYAYRFIFANAVRTMQFDNPTTSKLPFPDINLSQKSDKDKHDRLVALVDSMLALKIRERGETLPQTKIMLGRQIAAVDAQIDALVYALYGLTEEEIGVVEGKVVSD